MDIKSFCISLEEHIKTTYQQSITLEEAEKLASRFLHGMIVISKELSSADLDYRMKKSGVKAVKAAIYLDEVYKNEKKPSDTLLGAKVDLNELTQSEQEKMDKAEVLLNELQNYYNIFKEAHIHYRGISKGRFDG